MSRPIACFALFAAALVPAACGKSNEAPPFSHLEVQGNSVIVTNGTPLKISGPGSFKLIGPHHFTKKTDSGLTFEVSLASYVSPDVLVSVPAERQVPPHGDLNYGNLPPAAWPDDTFHTLSSTCTHLTRKQVEQLPESTGAQWVLDAGFEPEGDFAIKSTIKSSADGNDEVSIEIIARVESCEDASAVSAAIERVRSEFKVKSGR